VSSRVLMDRRRLRVTWLHQGPDEWAGRFGGGWQWEVGFQAGARFRTVIANLLVASVRFERPRNRGQR
jgi:hypothetical protein